MKQISAQPLDNRGVRDALQAGGPLLMGTRNHAMVLVSLAYIEVNGDILPKGGLVLDPAPSPFGSAVGVRPLRTEEMQAFFGADVVVTH